MKTSTFFRFLIPVLLTVITANPCTAQQADNYFTICERWEQYFDSLPNLKTKEEGGYHEFQLWKEFWRTRVLNGNPDDMGNMDIYQTGLKAFYANKDYFSRSTDIYSDWHSLGPNTLPLPYLGQISAVYVDTISDKSGNTIYAGTNSSGIWRTNDGGAYWSNLTDGNSFNINGITDIIGYPGDPNTLYVSTGGGFMGDHSICSGIIRSQNAGQTWEQFYPVNPMTMRSVNALIIDPTNSDHIFALVDSSVLRTIDGGSSWSEILHIGSLQHTGNVEKRYFLNMVMKPGDPSTIYVASANWHWANSHQQEVWKISNALASDTSNIIRQRIDPLLPNNGKPIRCERFNVAVTPVDPNAVYVACNEVTPDTIITGADTTIYLEKLKIWKYRNNIWHKEIDTAGWSNGIGYFKFEFLVSPTDTNVIYIGGLTAERIVKSNNGWQLEVLTPEQQRDSTYHFDTRDLKITKGSSPGNHGNIDHLYAGTDGGISKSTNGIASWKNINGVGLAITQFWGMGSTDATPGTVSCGSQDNSYFQYMNNTWYSSENGDRGNVLVTPNAPQVMYGTVWGSGTSGIQWSADGGLTWNNSNADTCHLQVRLANTPMQLNPQNPKSFIFAAEHLYKSYDTLHSSLETIRVPQRECSTCPANPIVAFAVAPTDTSRMYVVISGFPQNQPKKFLRTSNNGQDWTNLTDSVVIKQRKIFDNYFASDILVSPQNKNIIWMGLCGFYYPGGDSARIIVSKNGGATFENYSKGLPNMPVNCIRYVNGTPDGLLAGTDAGVYYIDNSLTEWQPFNTALPVVPVTDLEINNTTKQVRAATFGRGLWETSLDCIFNEDPLVINQNVTWVHDTVMNNSVIIDSTYTLTIKGRVLFPPMAKIFVRQGGKLIVDGGILTNKCYNYWQGIEVWGREDKPQNTNYQGKAAFRNGAVVENARIGVTTCRKNDNGEIIFSTSGAIIKADNCTFRNNYKAFEGVGNKYGQKSTFTRVLFETTPEYMQDAAPSDFVSLLGVVGIQFAGCTFRNTKTPEGTIPGSNAGRGIFSIQSNFLVDQYEYCTTPVVPCPQPLVAPCLFKGLRYGIRALGTMPNGTMTVRNSRFENNYRGLCVLGVDNTVVTRDTFTVYTHMNNLDTLYGLYLGNSTGYKVQENRFYCNGNTLITPTNAAPSRQQREFGIVIDSSGSLPNEIYKNYFEHFDVAINAQRQNKHPNDSTGLVLKCNTYNDNSYDEMITDGFYHTVYGIASKQGAKTNSPKDPAGNTFSPYHAQFSLNGTQGKLDLLNEAETIKYFHHLQSNQPGTPRVRPTLVDTSTVYRIDTYMAFQESICCPSRFSPGGENSDLELLIAQYSENQNRSDSLQSSLFGLVDGGNTDGLNTEIMLSTSPEALQLRDELLDKSPYLTDTVMKAAIEKESVLPNEMIRDIMVANPQFSQSAEVLGKLDDRLVQMPEPMMNEILENVDSLSQKDKLEAELQAAIIKSRGSLNELVRYYKNDTLNLSSSDSVITLLMNESSVESRYSLAAEYFAKGDDDEVTAILEAINQQSNLNFSQQQQYENYNSYLSYLIGHNTEHRNFFQLPIEDTTSLINLTTESVEPVRTFTQNILEANALRINNEIVIIPDETKSAQDRKPHRISKATSSVLFDIFPNPSNDYLIIDYNCAVNLQQGEYFSLTITNINGVTVATYNLSKKQDQVLYRTSTYVTGLYVCTLTYKEKKVASGKFVVKH